MARNLSVIAAHSAKGLPEMAMTRRTMFLERGMMAKRPALAAPAPGPNLKYRVKNQFRKLKLSFTRQNIFIITSRIIMEENLIRI